MTHTAVADLSTESVEYSLRTDGALRLERFGLPSQPWADSSSALFAAEIDGRRIDAGTPGLAVQGVTMNEERPGARHATVRLSHGESGVAIEHHTISYAGTALIETW